MNKFLFSLILIASLYLFDSCSSKINNSIVGEWEFVKGYAEVEASPDQEKKTIEQYYAYTLDSGEITTMEFRADGKGTRVDVEIYKEEKNTYTSDFNYSISGNKITLSYEDDDFTTTFSIDNNVLTISEDVTKEDKQEFENSNPNCKVSKIIEKEDYQRKNKHEI